MKEELLEQWVHILGLEKWHIFPNLNATPEEFSDSGELRAGEAQYDVVNRTANILILKQEAWARPEEYNFERTLVHELLHLVFAPFYPNTGDCLEIVIHMTLEDLAGAFVEAKSFCIENVSDDESN